MSYPNVHCEPLLAKQEKRLRVRGIKPDDIDDIMQEVRIHVFQHANPDASYNEMNRWIFILTGHRMQTHFKRNKRHRDLPMPEYDTPMKIDGKMLDFSDKGNLESRLVNSMFAESILASMPQSRADAIRMLAEGGSWFDAVDATGADGKFRMHEYRKKMRTKHGTY